MAEFVLDRENYYSAEANRRYMSVSLYKEFAGTYGRLGCQFCAMEKLNGRWVDPPSDAMLIGSYVDAWVEGPDSFDRFRAENPGLYKCNGELYAKYQIAETVIGRISRDRIFMKWLSGEKQRIMTGEIGGYPWKIRMDSYLPGQAIVDLKVVRSLSRNDNDKKFVRDLGKLDFIEYWGYDIQGAVYREIVRQNTGETLPFIIAAASKEEYPDIALIQITPKNLDAALIKVEENLPKILRVINGEAEPDRCEVCNCCKDSKVLTGWIWQDELSIAI